MKNLTIILALVAFGFMAKAQTIGDRNSGKYYANPKIDKITGSWISNEEGKEIEFEITTKRVHYKSISLDYYGDAIYINIIKYMNKWRRFCQKTDRAFNVNRYLQSLWGYPSRSNYKK